MKGFIIDYGNLNHLLRLSCRECKWIPDQRLTVGVFRAHCKEEHGSPDVGLDLVPVCKCGTIMNATGETKPTGGGTKDYFECPKCGSVGFVKKDGKPNSFTECMT
jgi:hypothetical protein